MKENINIRRINFFHPVITYPVLWIGLLFTSSYTMSEKTVEVISVFWVVFIISSYYQYNVSGLKFFSTLFIDSKKNSLLPLKIIDKSKQIFEGIILIHIAILVFLIKILYRNSNPEFLRFQVSQALGGYIGFTLLVISVLYFYHLSIKLIQIEGLKARIVIIIKMVVIIYPYILLGSRALLGIYIFCFFVVYYFSKNVRIIHIISLSIFGGLGAVALRLSSILSSTDAGRLDFFYLNSILSKKDNFFESVLKLWDYTVSDIFFRTDIIIKSVPERYDFLGGEGLFFGFITMLPGKQISPYIALNHNLFYGSNEDIEYPPTLIAQFYLDFGYIGVILGALFVSFFYNYIFIKFYKKRDFSSLFLYTVFSFYFILSIYGALQLVYIILFPVITSILLKVLHIYKK